NQDATTDATLPIVREALTDVARGFTLITGSLCRACIKEVHYPREATVPITDDNLRDLMVSTLCRDSAGGPPSPESDRECYVSDNTDFEVLFMKRWKYRWFHSNDLRKVRPYKNSNWNEDQEPDYLATGVWPIQKTDDTDAGLHDTL